MTLQKALKELLIRSPFYGLFMLNLRKEIVTGDRISTAAVGPNGLGLTLYVNQEFWDQLTDENQIAILQHEVMHICFFHLTDDFRVDPVYHKLMNTAMDCAINQFITGLPEGCITLKSIYDIIQEPVPELQGAWDYFNLLLEHLKKNNPELMKQLAALNEMSGSHDMWPKDMSEAEKTLYRNQIKSQLKNTAEQVSKQAGRIPSEMKGILNQLKDKPAVFNWKKFFRRMVGNAITSEIKLTRMRPSKRIPDARGIQMKRKPTILVATDTSGSISDDDLSDFFSEIKHIYKTGVDVTVLEFDTQIQNNFKYKGKQEIQINGRGGTDATCVIEYYKQHKKEFSTCIIFTDGYLSTFKLPQCQSLIWVITKDGNITDYPGQTLYIS